MPQRKSTYYTQRSEHLLGSHLFKGGNLSNRVNTIVDRYFELIEGAKRSLNGMFSEAELAILKSAFDNWDTKDERATSLLQDADHLIEARVGELLAGADAINTEAAIAVRNKVADLSTAQLLAIIELVEANRVDHQGESNE